MADQPLPDPRWDDSSSVCLSCGYSLAGLTPPAPCPECGHLHTGRQFIVGGVPAARSVMSGWRIAAMVLIVIAGSFAPQLTVLIGVTVAWWASLIALGVGVAAVVYFVKSAPRSQGGKGLLIFANGSVTLMPLDMKVVPGTEQSIAATRLAGDEHIDLKRLSPVWARLRLIRPDATTTFSAGIRSPRESEPQLIEAIAECIVQARFPRAPQPPTPPDPNSAP